MVSKQKTAERDERRQLKLDAGLLSLKYPEIDSIVITMDYYQKGYSQLLMKRTVNFSPESPAYFLMECMKNDCLEGGFDLEPVIATMSRNRLESDDGEITCLGNDSSGHARVSYKVTIQYNNGN